MIRLHHVGIATRDLDGTAKHLAEVLRVRTSEPIVDDVQRVRLALAELGSGTFIELVEPRGPDSPAYRIAERGGGPYHVCGEVDDLDTALAHARERGALIVSRPAPAVAFGGRRIAFLYLSGNTLIELLER